VFISVSSTIRENSLEPSALEDRTHSKMRPTNSAVTRGLVSGRESLESPSGSSISSSMTSAVLIRRYRRVVAKSVDRFLPYKSRMAKASRSWRQRRETIETIDELKRLVPTVPKDDQLSRFDLLQHVIDYIFELQRQLRDPLTAVEDREP